MKSNFLLATLMILSASFSVSADEIQATRNCDVALNFDLSRVDNAEFAKLLSRKGYSSELISVTHDDFPLEQEFFLTIGASDNLFKQVIVELSQSEKIGQGSEVVFRQEKKRALNARKAIMNLLEDMPNCSTAE